MLWVVVPACRLVVPEGKPSTSRKKEGGSDTSEAEGSSLGTRDGSLKFRHESLLSIQSC